MHYLICQFCHTDLYAEGATILTVSTCTCAKETTFFTISISWWILNCPSFSSSSYGYWDMHHFICQFCHTDLYAKILLARMRKKQHFSQSLHRGELWTVCRLALAHTVTEICTTSFVNFVILICMLKIPTFSTCTCAKETTFFTISTSWWTLNCPSFSSSSYGYWDMHHFICQFCHTELYAEGAKILTISTCTYAKETTFFTISILWWTLNCPSFSSSSYGHWDMHHFICQFWLYAKIHTFSTCTCAKETTFFTISWWTLNCPSFSSSSYGYRDMHHFICQFCHTDLYAEGAKIHKFHVCERNNKFAGGHFVFIKYDENTPWSHRSAALFVKQLGAAKTHWFFVFSNMAKFWHFLHKLWRLVLIMAGISAIGPKELKDCSLTVFYYSIICCYSNKAFLIYYIEAPNATSHNQVLFFCWTFYLLHTKDLNCIVVLSM